MSSIFAITPDVDLIYAVVGIINVGISDISTLQQTFWDAGLKVHRGITHSLVYSIPTVFVFGLIARKNTYSRIFGALIFVTLFLLTILFISVIQSIILLIFMFSGVIITVISVRKGIKPKYIFVSALVAMLTHPFGDTVTGSSPDIFYPFNVNLLPNSILLSMDPTLNFLYAFILEIIVIWMAILIYIKLKTNKNTIQYIDKISSFGLAFFSAFYLIPPPTLEVSYYFVFLVLSFSIVGLYPIFYSNQINKLELKIEVLATILATITIALLSYLVIYILLT